MTTPGNLGYSFVISLPQAADRRLRRWVEATPGASWDVSGGHVTLARLTGDLEPEALVPAFLEACSGLGAFEVCFNLAVREEYWDKPGLEIVMLTGSTDDVAGIVELRERLLDALLPHHMALHEGQPYLPHVTLTTGLPPMEARALEAATAELELRFTAEEVTFWSGSETARAGYRADPPWHVVERVRLQPHQKRKAG